jgi:hypothetical protein
MSLLFNAVQANPQQSVFAAVGSGGGGSYPRDASFNSVTIDPSGGVPPLTLGLGGSGTVMGIRRIEEGKEEDYITFAPASSEMDLSNVVTINGAPYPPALPANASFTSVSATDASFTRVNGAVYPPGLGEVTVIRTGVLNFNAPTGTVTFSTPFSARPTISLQATTLPPWSGAPNGSGLFYIESADSNGFRVGFDGTIAFYDPMPLMWIAVGS